MDLKTWRLKPSELVLLYALLDCEDLPKWEIKRVRPHRTFHQTPTSCVLSDASRLPLEFWRLRAVRGRSIAKAIGSPVPSLGSCARALVLWDPRKHCKDGINDNQPRSPNVPKNNIFQVPMFTNKDIAKHPYHTPWEWKKTEAKGFTNDLRDSSRFIAILFVEKNHLPLATVWLRCLIFTGETAMLRSSLSFPTDERARVDC